MVIDCAARAAKVEVRMICETQNSLAVGRRTKVYAQSRRSDDSINNNDVDVAGKTLGAILAAITTLDGIAIY